MGFNAIMKFLLPKDKVFYTLFENIVANLLDMGKDFHEGIYKDSPENRQTQLKKLGEAEHRNDDFTHRVFVELGQNFITPFDREDIHALAMALDDVADYMYASYKKTVNYNVVSYDHYMKEMADVILKSLESLAKAIHELRNMRDLKQLNEACVVINSYENQADDVLDKALIELFSGTMDAVELIKLKEVYEDMEIITDKCEDAANVIESIIIKYS